MNLNDSMMLLPDNVGQGNPATYGAQYWLYQWDQNPLAKRYVNLKANDATRAWLSHSCEDAAEIEKAESKDYIQSKFFELLRDARIAGGAVMIMIVGDQDLEDPLDVDSIKQDEPLRLVTLMPQVSLSGYADYINNDILSKNYLLPDFYCASTNSQQKIHHSRCIRMAGYERPLSARAINPNSFGSSVLADIWTQMSTVTRAWSDLGGAIKKSNLDFIKIQGLYDSIQADSTNLPLFRRRINDMSNAADLTKMGLLDAENESIERASVSMSGFDECMARLLQSVSFAEGYPFSYFFGEMQSGLNTEGGADREAYFKSVSQLQENKLRPALCQFYEVYLRTVLGYMPDDFEFKFNPLKTLSDKEQGEVDEKRINSTIAAMDANLISRSTAMTTLSKMQAYDIPEEDIEAAKADDNEDEDTLAESMRENA